MQARNELAAVLLQRVHRDLAHARRDAQIGDDVGAIGDLDADLGVRRASGTHQVGHDVHRAPAHRAVEELADALLGGFRVHPVVGWAGVLLALGAD